MRPSNSTPRYLRKLYLLQEFGFLRLGWRLVLLSHYILVSGASLNINYFMSCDINLTGKIFKVYCLWPTNGQLIVAVNSSTILPFMVFISRFCLIGLFASRCTLRRVTRCSAPAREQHRSWTGCSITSLCVSYCSRSLHKISSARPTWRWHVVFVTPSVHLL